MVYNCFNECNQHEECMVEYMDKRGNDGRADCESFYEHMENPDHGDDDDDDDGECGIWEEEYDCMEMAGEFVEYLDECRFVEKYDSCREEVVECKVTVKVMGEKYEGDCEEIADEFGIDIDDVDDECEVTCMDPFPCHAETPYEWCEMVECFDHCYEESVCYAEWTDMKGEYQSAECDKLHQEEECDKRGRPENVCEYEQCDKKAGGDCWFEKCNSESECGKPSCTKWWYDEKRNYWLAEDCSDKKKEDDMDYEQFFHHTVNFISHYDDTFMLISENFLGDVMGLSEPIDMWLQDEGAKYAASVVLQDTEEALNYLGMDVDFDPIHAALGAESVDEIKEMLDSIDFDDLMDMDMDDDKEDYGRGDKDDEDDYGRGDKDDEDDWDMDDDKDDYGRGDKDDEDDWDMDDDKDDYGRGDRDDYEDEWDMDDDKEDYGRGDRDDYDDEWDWSEDDKEDYGHGDDEDDWDWSEDDYWMDDYSDKDWDNSEWDSEWDMDDKSGDDMSDYDWSGYDWSDDDKSGEDMSGYDWSGYDWSDDDKSGEDMSGYDWSGYDWSDDDKSGEDMSGYDWSGYDWSDDDKSGEDMSGYDWSGYDWSGDDMSDYDWSGYDMSGNDWFDESSYDYYESGWDTENWSGEDWANYSGEDWTNHSEGDMMDSEGDWDMTVRHARGRRGK